MSQVAEPVMRAEVVVTFLRMDRPPADPAPSFPPGLEVVVEPYCSVATYRRLYNTVGASYLWWLRRAMPDAQLAALLRSPAISIHILRDGDRELGFYELDATAWPTVNLSYFGLMPPAVGRGIGLAFLRHAVDQVWSSGARMMTVNTCTADHERALPTYLRAGFRPVREVREHWAVPVRLGLELPARLRG
ncbi:GNAT family N-acetyltransferase [Rhodovastum atsumiense]|uniref:GNAT family N-acetyltransferase n=1 Tax=Rhodovastum atsumiense TaxID=504468 RepID=A0A5M6INI1_9PROT|nr:GNAT family N-acetyltransferase [Rhodovastum atsumiense]KAA5609547.1 GNAT family N-acetyltransferase [Rhodovastum atsumiense]CAH2604924.1 GNAT family N-acetyltransferase [Rhodovastum atsumiense]